MDSSHCVLKQILSANIGYTSKKIAKRFALCAHSPSPPLNFRVDFRSAECVPPRPRSISDWQSVFHHVPFDFRSAECVPPRPGSNSGQQSVFHRVPGQFPVGRVCSAASRVNFQSAECVLLRPGSISGEQRVFRHVLGQFPVGRVCSVASQVDLQVAEGGYICR